MFPIRDHNPSERTPYVTYGLIVINVVIWVYGALFLTTEMDLSRLYYDYAMIPARLNNGENYSALVTSVFLHAGLMHLAGNMLFLWIFGDNIEDKLGHIPFLIFYLVCGVGADLAQFAVDPWSPVATIGASGAIAGVMGAYLLLFPKAKVDIFLFLIVIFRIFPIPAWVMLGLWFALQAVQSLGSFSTTGGGVAYWAHSGGFVIGLVLIVPFWLRLGGTSFWQRTRGHPDHPPAKYPLIESRIPNVRRK